METGERERGEKKMNWKRGGKKKKEKSTGKYEVYEDCV